MLTRFPNMAITFRPHLTAHATNNIGTEGDKFLLYRMSPRVLFSYCITREFSRNILSVLTIIETFVEHFNLPYT